MILMDWDIFSKKTVIVTGHTGFKGSWLSRWLSNLGADVYGISNAIPTDPSHFNLLDRSTFVKDIMCCLVCF